MAKVSVIIPVYNGESSIATSILSLVNQSYSDFEVIIIDDGSNDKTREVIYQLTKSDKRFRYFYQTNSGVSSARNAGLDFAQGDFISFLDSDDFYENTYLEKLINQIEKTSANVCYCGYNIVSPRTKSNKNTMFKTNNLLNEYILGRVSIHTTGWVISKDFLNEYNIRFPNNISWGEDFEFFCQVLSRSNKNTYVSEYLTNYRIGFEENRLSSFSMNKLDSDFDMIQRLLNLSSKTKSEQIESSLLKYRLQALLIYRLLLGFKSGVPFREIEEYYIKYCRYIAPWYWVNGLRSFKLNIHKLRLLVKIFNLRRLQT